MYCIIHFPVSNFHFFDRQSVWRHWSQAPRPAPQGTQIILFFLYFLYFTIVNWNLPSVLFSLIFIIILIVGQRTVFIDIYHYTYCRATFTSLISISEALFPPSSFVLTFRFSSFLSLYFFDSFLSPSSFYF